MPSREGRRRLAVAVLLAGGVAFAVLGLWTAAARSTIPVGLDGTVDAIEVRAEKHPGVDDAWVVRIDGVDRHLDAAVASTLAEGDRVEKEPWSRTLVVDGEARVLHLSDDARGMAVLAPAAGVLCVALALPRGAGRRGGSPSQAP